MGQTTHQSSFNLQDIFLYASSPTVSTMRQHIVYYIYNLHKFTEYVNSLKRALGYTVLDLPLSFLHLVAYLASRLVVQFQAAELHLPINYYIYISPYIWDQPVYRHVYTQYKLYKESYGKNKYGRFHFMCVCLLVQSLVSSDSHSETSYNHTVVRAVFIDYK